MEVDQPLVLQPSAVEEEKQVLSQATITETDNEYT
jgi:hypothetical protein